MDLSNKVALVTGGSRGIGAAITECLCKAGATTFFTHTGNPKYLQRIEELLRSIDRAGGSAKAEAIDACNSEETASLIERIVKEHGRIDILVTNVGQNIEFTPEELTDAQWANGIRINLDSAFYAIRTVLPHMTKAAYGRIILIASSAVYDGGGGALDYAAGKAGIEGMMKYLSRKYARKGILTNVVHPCVIETDLLRIRYSDEKNKEKLIAQVPVGRLGKPEDIAGLVTYLASRWGDFICGQSILVDGGRTFYK